MSSVVISTVLNIFCLYLVRGPVGQDLKQENTLLLLYKLGCHENYWCVGAVSGLTAP